MEAPIWVDINVDPHCIWGSMVGLPSFLLMWEVNNCKAILLVLCNLVCAFFQGEEEGRLVRLSPMENQEVSERE